MGSLWSERTMIKSYDEYRTEVRKLLEPKDLIYRDNVNKPSHYTYGKLECIDVIREVTNGNDAIGIEAFCLGNVLKYLWRYKHKNGTEDLKKAMWYLERLIKESE